jgi:transaldolase
MSNITYLQWLSNSTSTTWWNDSGIPAEIENALANGAVGVTTNPVLTARALAGKLEEWNDEISYILNNDDQSQKALQLTSIFVKSAAIQMMEIFKSSQGKDGYVCAQVDPASASDRAAMLSAAEFYNTIGENISVKLPATAAGLDVMETCVKKGIHVTMTVSFTVSQVLAIAERYEKAKKLAEEQNVTPGTCYAVVMIGRLDDYIRDIAHDSNADISESDIQSAGLAVVKKAYQIYQEKNYSAKLIIAAMRGVYHITELAGSDIVLSIHPAYQKILANNPPPTIEMIQNPVNKQTIERLLQIPEFSKAFEIGGLSEKEFISYGVEQRTLSQFSEIGWKKIVSFTH